ncbi:hypothetical protein CCH79_00001230 [Gambusia affinis]|uniref:Uncharacterized protein n=1 Tax=Gambusia affinis TaxID=33528 RepID=A0A315VTJ7_GAMAF|nr:hypothetical protein CCH79_00001230 [Gambusia affinis]
MRIVCTHPAKLALVNSQKCRFSLLSLPSLLPRLQLRKTGPIRGTSAAYEHGIEMDSFKSRLNQPSELCLTLSLHGLLSYG